MRSSLRYLSLLLVILLSACTRQPLKDPKQAMRPVSAPELSDDLDLDALAKAVTAQADFMEKAPGFQTLSFGPRSYSKAEYVAGLRHFAELVRGTPGRAQLFEAIRRDFDFYEVYGNKSWGDIFMTSYYEAVVKGARKPTLQFDRPLYRQPDDLISLDLTPFDPQKYALDRKLRGRLVDRKLVPYFTREEIDVKGALKGRRLELVWVDPVDAADIQVQGSGRVVFADGTSMRVGYADKNGAPYDSVGKFVRDFIPKEQLSLQAIEDYLRTLSRDRMQEVLNKNASYVFFKEMPEPLTYMGVAAVDGRTIATDHRFFPKGALAFLVSTKPKWDKPLAEGSKQYVPAEWQPFSRFVLDQDIGGAITGGGRLDLYWGSGDEAKRNAGVIKQTGTLYYLVPKAPGQ